jgi:phospholipid:diacylglycerol acyltransferase
LRRVECSDNKGRYWIWNKIVENLASIGYDPTTAYTASYDWRLAYPDLEKRDKYFSRLKTYIETSNKLSGKKAVLVAHSMGSQVVHYFFKWVEAEGHGNGGNRWVEDNIDSFINVLFSHFQISGALQLTIRDR